MKYLLDTHIFLWSLTNHRRLKDSVKKILIDPKRVIYVSIVSAWELAIKLKTNPNFKLKISLRKAFEISDFEILTITFEHAVKIQRLPLLHKDPFDRMLISQAKFEKLTLITADPKIWKYKLALLKA